MIRFLALLVLLAGGVGGYFYFYGQPSFPPTPNTFLNPVLAVETANVEYDALMFKTAAQRLALEEKQVFAPILDSTYHKQPAVFLQQMRTALFPDLNRRAHLVRKQRVGLAGLIDSAWYVCLEADSLNMDCRYSMERRHCFFSADGRLLNGFTTLECTFLEHPHFEKSLLVTTTVRCDGVGQHKVWKVEQGTFVEVMDPIFKKELISFCDRDSLWTYMPAGLRFVPKQLDQDTFWDLALEGQKQWFTPRGYKGKREPVLFSYRFDPMKGWFVPL